MTIEGCIQHGLPKIAIYFTSRAKTSKTCSNVKRIVWTRKRLVSSKACHRLICCHALNWRSLRSPCGPWHCTDTNSFTSRETPQTSSTLLEKVSFQWICSTMWKARRFSRLSRWKSSRIQEMPNGMKTHSTRRTTAKSTKASSSTWSKIGRSSGLKTSCCRVNSKILIAVSMFFNSSSYLIKKRLKITRRVSNASANKLRSSLFLRKSYLSSVRKTSMPLFGNGFPRWPQTSSRNESRK